VRGRRRELLGKALTGPPTIRWSSGSSPHSS
jgi:hypothetical protein